MSAITLAPAPLPAPPSPADPARHAQRAKGRRVFAAAAALFLVYVALSVVVNDHRGTLGSDTGGKLATLASMDASADLSPDLGYWAERYDPDGSLHPLYFSGRVAGGEWITVSTLPMLYAAAPLYALGGSQAVLLIPMAAAVAAALAARALAARFGGAPWAAFWLVGLATPLTVYALDFWEHALGAAAILWAIVLLYDVVDRRAGWRAAGGAGALFGLAATMRTEALVYVAVTAAVVGIVVCVRRRPIRQVVALAVSGALGGVAALVANTLLEHAVLGSSIRTGRTTAVAGAAAGDVASGEVTERLRAAGTTLLGMNHWPDPLDLVVGALLVLLVAYGAWRCSLATPMSRKVGAGALVIATVLYAVRFGDGLGFLPGVLTASPLAVAGLLAFRNSRARPWLIVAVAAIPLVWFLQYADGLRPQWGGRYLLVSSLLLAIVGIVWLLPRDGTRGGRAAAPLIMVLALAVTASGVAWLGERSHTVADGMEQIVARGDDAVISRDAHLFRDGGAFYTRERKWLTAPYGRDVHEAIRVVTRAGVDEFALITHADQAVPSRLGAFRRGARESIETLPSKVMTVTTYRR